ncbi:D-alanine--D-alanine ligase family protein [Trueperella pecoris]|uniref:D-alanine--D-alanine ligase n=1 Tax=Trueperella pecoris TaxID=2733571 RepID=A0A7M1QU71_9ACTO|nr:D-alanine--D-alanine ligase family protein [Trueperella pecoris]QOR44915.1 D-alanine--D-alanine ligase [Trueperella pecoris]QTG74824.1 D-alanine--D-alanine ligase [Trueperella pecoris]
MKKIRIALIYGGVSGEHPISCATAGAIMRALDPQRYDVISIGIRRDGTWVPGVSDPSKLDLSQGLTEVAPSDRRIVIPPGAGDQPLLEFSDDGEQARSLGPVDVAFPVLHGPFGEDGTVQGLLEMAGIPYVGCGVFSSAAGMDKDFMKKVLIMAGIPVGPYVAVTARRWRTHRDEVLADVSTLSFPLYIKPARAGSSLGISKVRSLEGVPSAVEAAHAYDPKVVIEQGIAGREVECAVLGGHGDQPSRASVLGEVLLEAPEGGFYDFDSKYISTDGLTMSIPAQLDEATTQRVRELAVQTFDAFECEGLTRVDFFVPEEGEPIVNEINTMPGFTPFSMYPALWGEAGVSYGELVDELVNLALERPRGLR